MQRGGWTKHHRQRWDKGYHLDLLLWVIMDYFIDFAIETGKTLRKTSKTPLSTFNEDMIGTGFDFDPSDLSQGSANMDAGDDFNTSFDECPYLNLSEIAERILYDIVSVTLVFENDDGDVFSETIDFTGDTEKKICDAVSYWANNSYFLNV